MAAKYVAFIGSLTVKTTVENARKVNEIVVHSKMRLVEPWSYDIALLRMAREMAYSENVAPICLPTENTPEMFETVFVAG